MAKVIVTKGKSASIEGKKRKLSTTRFHYHADETKDLHLQEGMVKAKDLKNGEIKTNRNKSLYCFDAGFIDEYNAIRRGAQIIPKKDIGLIITETGLTNDAVVVDAGAGSGALSTFLAKIAKKVTTYEIRDDFAKIVEKNIEALKLKNLSLKKKSIYEGIDEKNVDLITLDLPEPWKAIEHAEKALKLGGFLVLYTPSVPQMQDAVNELLQNEHFIVLKSTEVIEREWEVDGRKVRPKSASIGHSGFLTFARKIQ